MGVERTDRDRTIEVVADELSKRAFDSDPGRRRAQIETIAAWLSHDRDHCLAVAECLRERANTGNPADPDALLELADVLEMDADAEGE